MTIVSAGEAVSELFVRPDYDAPTFTAYLNVSDYFGKVITFCIEGETDFRFEPREQARRADGPTCVRPLLHFTCDNGWLNDPDGLIYADGIYHMYYQYNPLDVHWTNMHWGHAVSKDLLHWTDCGAVLCPDRYGMMYSGSAVYDAENRSGLGKNGVAPILYYYTAEGKFHDICKGQKTRQHLAYSSDGGKTLVKYGPIVENIAEGNRDPKVTYVEELDRYVMALYLQDDRYALLASTDLLHFTEIQTFSVEGEWECPNLAKVPVEGETQSKWLFFGAKGKYVVGRFENGAFVAESRPLTVCHATAGYAGQIFSGTGERCVGIDWLKSAIPEKNFAQQMSLPYTLSLRKVGGEWAVVKRPVGELTAVSQSMPLQENAWIAGRFETELIGKAFDVRLSAAGAEGVYTLRFFGNTVTVDCEKNTVSCGAFSSPLRATNGLDVRILIDAYSIEVYADGGLYAFAATPCMHYAENKLTIESAAAMPLAVTLFRLIAPENATAKG